MSVVVLAKVVDTTSWLDETTFSIDWFVVAMLVVVVVVVDVALFVLLLNILNEVVGKPAKLF